MALRMFQIARKSLCESRIIPRNQWSPPNMKMSSKSSFTGKEQTEGEKKALAVVKALAIFLPGVYIGTIIKRETDEGTLMKDDAKHQKEPDSTPSPESVK